MTSTTATAPKPSTGPGRTPKTPAEKADVASARYLSRVAMPPVSNKIPPDPRWAALLTIAAPIAAVLIGWQLLEAIGIGNSTAYSVSHTGVRTAIGQVLEKELAADRIQDVLTHVPDPTPGTDDKTKAARTAARTARIKGVGARLSGSRARLADQLTTRALRPHPGLDKTVRAEESTSPRERMAALVATRLDDAAIKSAAQTWALDSQDAYTRTLATNAVGKPEIAADAVAGSLAGDVIRRAVGDVVALRFDSFDTRAGESAWAGDVTARLTWAIVALVFSLSFALVAFTSGVQISQIGGSDRRQFMLYTTAAAIAAGVVAYAVFGPGESSTPLHRALQDYAGLFGVRMLSWAAIFNVLRAVGVVLLIAGSVATFWVKVSTVEELQEQLRGFKALFNSGAVFLMAGVLEMYALFRWPVMFAGDDATRAALQAAAATFAAVLGAFFSVVLFATYFATTLILRRQAIAHNVSEEAVDKALTAFGFADFTSHQVLRASQALLPLLPGVVTVLL